MESNLNKPRLVPMDTEKMSAECKEILKRIPGDTKFNPDLALNTVKTLSFSSLSDPSLNGDK
jgi:hypothetical protein